MATRDQTVLATFDSVDRAERAVDQLRKEGFRENEISVIARDDRGADRTESSSRDRDRSMMDMGDQDLTEGTTSGAAAGAGAGLLASAGALAIPGIGPILAAGPIAATLSGAVTGGLAGGLLDFGIPRQRGRQVEEDVRSGRAVALIETDDSGADRVCRLLKEAGARDTEVHRR